MEGRALHSQECFLPPRGGFKSTMHPVAQQRKRPGRECFLPPRGGFNLRCTQSPRKSLKDWAQCLRQLNFKNRLLPTGDTVVLPPPLKSRSFHSGDRGSAPPRPHLPDEPVLASKMALAQSWPPWHDKTRLEWRT